MEIRFVYILDYIFNVMHSQIMLISKRYLRTIFFLPISYHIFGNDE